MKSALVVYVPVIHSGYLKLLERHKDSDVFVVSEILVKDLDLVLAQKLPRQLNAIASADAVFCLKQIAVCSKNINLLTYIDELDEYDQVIMPFSDIGKLIEVRLSIKNIVWDYKFLQYDWGSANAKKEVVVDSEITSDELAIALMGKAQELANNSSDWWRHVGALFVKNGEVLYGSYNQHLVDDEIPYIFGNPRWPLNAGENQDLCGPIHAEANMIAQAARDGVSLKGGDLYATTYPCHPCAKLIATAGISRVFFRDGYSTLDSKETFEKFGIKVIRVLPKQKALSV